MTTELLERAKFNARLLAELQRGETCPKRIRQLELAQMNAITIEEGLRKLIDRQNRVIL